MQDQKTAGQAEDWELSEAYYKEDTGKKEPCGAKRLGRESVVRTWRSRGEEKTFGHEKVRKRKSCTGVEKSRRRKHRAKNK